VIKLIVADPVQPHVCVGRYHKVESGPNWTAFCEWWRQPTSGDPLFAYESHAHESLRRSFRLSLVSLEHRTRFRNATVWQTSNTESFREQAPNVQYSLISMENPNPEAKNRTGVIDVIAEDPKTGEVVLVMNEANEWDSSDQELLALQERFNAYVSFLLDGELAEVHPELVGKPARIALRCAQMPDARALEFLGLIHDQLAFQEIKLEVIVTNDPPSPKPTT